MQLCRWLNDCIALALSWREVIGVNQSGLFPGLWLNGVLISSNCVSTCLKPKT